MTRAVFSSREQPQTFGNKTSLEAPTRNFTYFHQFLASRTSDRGSECFRGLATENVCLVNCSNRSRERLPTLLLLRKSVGNPIFVSVAYFAAPLGANSEQKRRTSRTRNICKNYHVIFKSCQDSWVNSENYWNWILQLGYNRNTCLVFIIMNW